MKKYLIRKAFFMLAVCCHIIVFPLGLFAASELKEDANTNQEIVVPLNGGIIME